MPGTTTGGFPYALPEDPLVQWPATSQSLAEKINTEINAARDSIVTGSTDFSPAGGMAAGSTYTFAITFPAGRFTLAPVVTATYRPYTGAAAPGYSAPAGGASAFLAFPVVSGVTAAGFSLTLVAINELTAPGSVQWAAVYRG